jgi:hypothetical protein
MAALAAKNEKIRAVGNMKVNARGDTIDGQGRVIESVNEKVTQQYAKTVGNRSARPVTTRSQQTQPPKVDTPKFDEIKEIAPIVEEKLPTEEDFDSEDDLEIEQIKEEEVKKAKKK